MSLPQVAGMVIGAQLLLIFGGLRVIRNMVRERERQEAGALVVADAEAFIRRTWDRIEAEQ